MTFKLYYLYRPLFYCPYFETRLLGKVCIISQTFKNNISPVEHTEKHIITLEHETESYSNFCRKGKSNSGQNNNFIIIISFSNTEHIILPQQKARHQGPVSHYPCNKSSDYTLFSYQKQFDQQDVAYAVQSKFSKRKLFNGNFKWLNSRALSATACRSGVHIPCRALFSCF